MNARIEVIVGADRPPPTGVPPRRDGESERR
jgi:hypothetical protein